MTKLICLLTFKLFQFPAHIPALMWDVEREPAFHDGFDSDPWEDGGLRLLQIPALPSKTKSGKNS